MDDTVRHDQSAAQTFARSRFLAGASASALALLQASPVRAADTHTGAEITIAGPPNDSSAVFLYANDLGNYAKAGLNARTQVINNAGTIAAAVAAGGVTIGIFSLPSLAIAYDHGVALRLVAPAAVYMSTMPTTGLIVLKSSPLQHASDLNGKVVGVRDINNLNTIATKVWLAQNGGDVASVKFIEIVEAQSVDSMKAGRIDAACISNPYFSDATKGDARTFATVYDTVAKYFLVAGFVTTEAYAHANPDVVRKVASAISTTAKWANRNQAASAKILEKYSGSPVTPDIPRVHYAEELRAIDVQPVMDMLYKNGAIKKPISAASLFALPPS
jgi:NitT/TauT family transport system substrate-binding protein